MVLAKLSREFNSTSTSSSSGGGGLYHHRRKGSSGVKDSAAVLASAGLASALNLPPPQQMMGLSSAHLGMHPALGGGSSCANVNVGGGGMGMGMGARIREGLFGRSVANVNTCSVVGSENGVGMGGSRATNGSMLSDARSVMVPLIISR